jgi:tRNA threonylcarbamoyladenosine biosynthesis protein TsaB
MSVAPTGVVLGIETATPVCSAALFIGEACVAIREHSDGMAHAEKLTVFIDELLQDAGMHLRQIDAVAVSGGPGSYTGLRIGVSTAKGICWSLDKPLIAVPTLESMAAGASIMIGKNGREATARLCPMLDARRMEVYTALYDMDGALIAPVTAKIIEPHAIDDWMNEGPVWFFGDGMSKCREVLSVHPNARFLDEYRVSARDLLRPALKALADRSFVHTGLYEPFYLKEFVAGKGSALPAGK